MTLSKKIFIPTDVAWRRFKHDDQCIFVKGLSDERSTSISTSLCRHHLEKAKSGLVATIESNEEHGYRNIGQ